MTALTARRPPQALPAAAGIDVLRAMQAGLVPVPPAVELLGLVLEEVGPGTATMTFPVHAGFANPRHVHGGILAAVADVVATTAVLSALAEGVDVVTADLHVSYLRAVRLDAGELRCTGTVVHLGRTQANATVEIERDGRAVVRATATCRLLGPPAP
jgi:uncharacterized protein (TIGR00369 family)